MAESLQLYAKIPDWTVLHDAKSHRDILPTVLLSWYFEIRIISVDRYPMGFRPCSSPIKRIGYDMQVIPNTRDLLRLLP